VKSILSELGAPEPVWDSSAARRRFEIRNLVAALATNFVNVPPEQIDSAVCDTLEAVARFAAADRAVLAVFERGGAGWSISHEWFGQGLRPFKDHVAELPALPWTLAEFRARRPIRVTAGAPAKSSADEAEREMVEALGLRCAFVIPVFVAGKLAGAAGIGAANVSNIEWPEDLATLLELPGRFMLDALARCSRERTRRANETLWRSFCACEVVGVFILDRNGRVLESNDTGLRIVGRSHAELAAGAVEWENFTPREYQSLDLRALERLDHGDMVIPWEKQVQRQDGSRVPVLATLASLAPFAPELLSLCIDLSERERAQKELRRSNEFDRLLASLSRRLITLPFASIDQAISEALAEVGRFFDLDRVGLFEAAADRDVEELRLGWLADPHEAVPARLNQVRLEALPWWRERLLAGRTIYLPTIDSLPPQADSERAMLESNRVKGFLAIPLYPGRVIRGAIHFASFRPLDLSDHHLALLRVFCDIVANARERKFADDEIHSAREALERRVNHRRTQLEASNAELEAFAYSVSHDLRAPLRTIDGLSLVLLEDFAAELGDDARALLDRIRQATLRMSHLIDALLQLSRVARTEIEWKPVDLSAIAAELVEKQRACDPGRKVEIDIAPGVSVVGHAGLLRVALGQLIDNAWKFSVRRPLAHVRFGTERIDGECVYFLRDDGAGFDPASAGKLFGAFQRLHTEGEFEGNGLGLATVDRVVRMHGGRAWATSEPDGGATIFFTLASQTGRGRE